MAAEDAAVTVSLRANLKDYEAALKSAVRATERAATAAEKTLSNVGKKSNFNVIQGGAAQAGRSMNAMQADAKNLGFQFNDLATSIASGGGALRAFAQQGGQISQIFSGMGLASMGKLITTALLDPFVLIPIAIGVATVAFSNFFDTAETETANHRKVLDDIKKKWGDLIPGVKEYIDSIYDATTAVEKHAAKVALIDDAWTDAQPAIADVTKDVQKLLQQMRLSDQAEEAAKIAKQFQAWRDELSEGRPGFEQLRALLKQITEVSKSGNSSAAQLAETINQKLSPALQGVQDKLEKIDTLFSGMRQTPLVGADTILGVQERTTLGGSAADVIKKEEGFRAGAYWDVNAFRAGFGSDTYVDEMGRVQQVTKDTVVTLNQANEDLARRIPEFQRTVKDAIGPGMWESLTEDQQAALTSIAYNYGHLPDAVAAAVKRGDHGQAAVAISNLSANPERRKREAALYAGGSAPAGDALKLADEAARAAEKEAEARARATENLAEYLEKLDEQATLEQRITDIKSSGMSADDQARAIAVETELQTALNVAKQNGLTLSAQEIAQIRAATLAKTEAKIAGDAFVKTQKDTADATKQFNQQISSMAQSAIGGLINDLRNGVEAGEAFNNMLNRIIDSLIQMALQSMFNPAGGGGIGAIIGQLFGVAHSGGIVGKTSFPRRQVNPAVFAGAKHFAKGGLVGGEVPIIAHRGEMIIPKNMVGKGGGNVTNNLGNISIDMSGTGMVAAGPEQAKAFGLQLQKLVQVQMVHESRPGGLLRRVPG